MRDSPRRIAACLIVVVVAGCGSTKSQLATEQLLVSDAVDRSIASIDFGVMAEKTVFLDTQFVKFQPTTGFVNADYIISSLRQQMLAAGCRLQERKEDAEYVVEARVGALATDNRNMIVGIPPTNTIGAAANVITQAPLIPPLPEISLVRRDDHMGAAKVAVFAYHRTTRVPVWQSGISQARSKARDTYVFGAGPFQHGTIYESPQFAGARLRMPTGSSRPRFRAQSEADTVPFREEHVFATSGESKPTAAARATVTDAAATTPAAVTASTDTEPGKNNRQDVSPTRFEQPPEPRPQLPPNPTPPPGK